jgi:hypothetical protein
VRDDRAAMQPNPYEPPVSAPGDPLASQLAPNRGPFVLAAIGAGLASVYWAALTLLLMFGAYNGATSPVQLVMPAVLIFLYAQRGYQLYQGDPRAASRILWLHAVGGIIALISIATGTGLLQVLHGIKVAIHVFGGIAAYLALRSVRS